MPLPETSNCFVKPKHLFEFQAQRSAVKRHKLFGGFTEHIFSRVIVAAQINVLAK
jgi:hypothetical protein